MPTDLKNRATDSEAASFVVEIERLEQEFESFKMGRLAEIAAQRKKASDKQKDVYEDGKSQGVPKGVVKAIVKSRALLRKADEFQGKSKDVMDELDLDQRDQAKGIREALGEDFSGLPLGAAAVAREESGPDATTAAIIGAVEEDEERQRIDAQRAADAKAFEENPPADLDPKASRANRSRKKADATA